MTRQNVAQLQQVCAFDAPEEVSFQSGLVAVGGTLYFTAFDTTYAIDGATCEQKWKQRREEPPTFLKVNRGVAYSDGRLFRGTGDAHVLALDAESGKVLWDVAIGDAKKGESAPAAPIAWQGLVFMGNAGGDNFGVRGRIYALDAASGKTVWQFETVSTTGPTAGTWEKATPQNPPNGGNTWTSYALDEASGILYVSTGNPGPDFAEQLHPGKNLYTNALLALDAKTGRLLAYVQPTHGDFHDWDLSAAPALITTREGRPLVAAGSKDGHLYGIDRSVVGSRRGTGPDAGALSVRYEALTTTRENVNAPLSTTHMTRFCPGSQGGIEWNGPTYLRERGLLYVNSIHWCTSVQLQPLSQLQQGGTPGQAWTGMADPKMPFGVQDPTSQWNGFITAVDAQTGQVRWQTKTPKPMVAGITATAGGLVFTGDLDGNVLALDADSGKELWRGATGKAIGGGVISYEAGRKQYVAAAAGLNSAIWPVQGGPARVVVYALP
ncbi:MULTISPECIES: PQQ-binding-like beta-propeller repeat protein [Myxococcaceae]|uniref:pyrroloquinoline quinone-dependent dehydrogenase n=1 Tax=Myxococcaceae TaxID=31 RepID=UPI00189076DE|nr:PQQ-binding-like beta-propeller repeat protein [Simulacricoccus sp. 17bor-14]